MTWKSEGCPQGRPPGGSAIQTGKGNLQVSRLVPGNAGRGEGQGQDGESLAGAEAQGHESLSIFDRIWRSRE